MNEHIVIITGAAPLDPDLVARIPHDSVLFAVDGGLDHALAAGLVPTHLIGDLDSVTDDGLAWAARNASISRHPTDKDRTDTELALELAVGMDPDRITLVGGGDRLDHTIAGLGALGGPSLTSVPELDAWWDGHHLRVVHGPGSIAWRVLPGSTLSLLAMHGPCTKVSITGTRWELDKVDIDPLVGLGMSNEVLPGDAPVDVEVSLVSGVLTVFDTPAESFGPPPQPADAIADRQRSDAADAHRPDGIHDRDDTGEDR